jgi:hypothetical protein
MDSFKLNLENSESNGNKEKAESRQNNNAIGSFIVGLIIMAGSFWYFYGGGLEKQTVKTMDSVYSQVVADSIEQYEITKRGGDKIDICVHAGLIVAAYLQAKDEINYQKWKRIQKADCDTAGMPK